MKVDIESGMYNTIKELYKSLYGDSESDATNVIKLCQKIEDGPLHVCTIHNDTPLHKATYIKKFDLANKLLDMLPENFSKSKLMRNNNWGNTLLHNASTSNKGAEFGKKLLKKAPELLQVKNKWGETAVFQAIRYGRKHVFNYLSNEVDNFCASQSEFNHLHFFQRNDKTTILHMAILTGYYDIAIIIARRYEDLCNVGAQDGLTPLQILACSPEAFSSGTEMGFLTRLIYSCISTHNRQHVQADEARGLIKKFKKSISSILGKCTEGKPWCRWPSVDTIRSQKKGHEEVLELAKILVPLDTSWMNTDKPRSEIKPSIIKIPVWDANKKEMEINVDVSENSSGEQEGDTKNRKTKNIENGLSNVNDTPLILAAKTGCIEIVEEILDLFPQAVEYLNHEGQNVSLVAVKNRNKNVFDLVMEKNLDLRSNLRVIDSHGNSILHMVGLQKETSAGVQLKTPVLQLSDDLLLYEELKMKCPRFLINHRNNDMKTAYELFATNNEKLRIQAKEWLKRTAEHCTAIIVLIATVAFAAAYTVPGGPDQKTGFPILIGKPFFLAFTMSDVLSLTFALTAVVIFLAILTSSYRLESFSRSLPQKLLLGLTLLFLSVSMMMVSFAATVILMTSRREEWTKIAVYVAAFFPVCIFVLSYIPLYIKLADTFKYWLKKCHLVLPVFACAPRSQFAKTFRRGGI